MGNTKEELLEDLAEKIKERETINTTIVNTISTLGMQLSGVEFQIKDILNQLDSFPEDNP
jgi:hypothetical protein